jgi:hypothetical protein
MFMRWAVIVERRVFTMRWYALTKMRWEVTVERRVFTMRRDALTKMRRNAFCHKLNYELITK